MNNFFTFFFFFFFLTCCELNTVQRGPLPLQRFWVRIQHKDEMRGGINQRHFKPRPAPPPPPPVAFVAAPAAGLPGMEEGCV